MPLLVDACADPQAGCCGDLFAFADYLRCQAAGALDQFFEGGCDSQITSYVSMGPGDDGIPDTLTVSTDTMLPSVGTQSVGFSAWNMTFEIRLRESGYPMLQRSGDVLEMPNPELQHKATAQLFAHGEAIHKRISALKEKRQLAPEGFRCLSGTVGALNPLPPLGGVAGWVLQVTIQMPWG